MGGGEGEDLEVFSWGGSVSCEEVTVGGVGEGEAEDG